ncbi:hypothetical protein E0198_004994 [Clavispora lusitaniae]|nr:hypothetical protein E0198_004994 [Clavispora lusitaniae]
MVEIVGRVWRILLFRRGFRAFFSPFSGRTRADFSEAQTAQIMEDNTEIPRPKSPYSKMNYISENIPTGSWENQCSRWRELAWKIFPEDRLTINEFLQRAFIDSIPHEVLRIEMLKIYPKKTLGELVSAAEDFVERYKIPEYKLRPDPRSCPPVIRVLRGERIVKNDQRYREGRSPSRRFRRRRHDRNYRRN